MHIADIFVICAYMVLLPCITLAVSHRANRAGDFLSAHSGLPWWAICLSLVATETSTLTFISVPGIGYTNGMVFAGLAGGYLIGRAIVAIWFLPLYARGAMTSVYQYLGERFDQRLQRIASGAFLATRLVAESVRLLAGMLPLVWLLAQAGIPMGRVSLLCLIMVATLIYTVLGGLRAVIWSDTIQLALYFFGAVFCVAWLWPETMNSGTMAAGWHLARSSGHLALFHPLTWNTLLADPFTPLAALFGGTILSVASHGTDQLLVQRVLAAGSLRSARSALIGSAIVVGVLFALLSLIGVQLWIRNGGASLAQLGLPASDDLFPRFIATGLPAGFAGLLVAGVLSATMGSLSATLNAMAGVLLTDFGPAPAQALRRVARFLRLNGSELAGARLATLFWAVALILCALLMGHSDRSAVIVGLTVAGWSYGPTLGVFVFGMIAKRAAVTDAMAGLVAALLGMAAFMLAAQMLGWHIAFPWFVPFGAAAMFLGALLSWGIRRFVPVKIHRLMRETAKNP